MVQRTFYPSASGGGGGTGTVESVNGIEPDGDGDVTLTAEHVAADPEGAASAAVADHVADVDPHGDRAYVDTELEEKANVVHTHTGVYQPLDSDLTAIAALAPDDGDMLGRESDEWVARSMEQVKTALALAKADVGLADADDTSDLDKPISTLTQAALDLKANTVHSHDSAYQPLDSDLTAFAALAPDDGDMPRRVGGVWVAQSMADVKTALALAKADVGLANVDNTSDLGKPVSTAQQTALDLKANTADALLKSVADAKGDLIVGTGADAFARLAVGADGQQPYADPTTSTGLAWRSADPYELAAGVTCIPRWMAVSATISLGASGTVRWMFFRAPRAETLTQLGVVTGGTAAGATPTLCRLGLYTVAGNNDLTLVASIANDTTLFNSQSASHTRTMTSSYDMVAGAWYAFAILVVTGAALPTFCGVSLNAATAIAAMAQRITGQLAAQSDLPASVTAANVAASNAGIMGVVLP